MLKYNNQVKVFKEAYRVKQAMKHSVNAGIFNEEDEQLDDQEYRVKQAKKHTVNLGIFNEEDE